MQRRPDAPGTVKAADEEGAKATKATRNQEHGRDLGESPSFAKRDTAYPIGEYQRIE